MNAYNSRGVTARVYGNSAGTSRADGRDRGVILPLPYVPGWVVLLIARFCRSAREALKMLVIKQTSRLRCVGGRHYANSVKRALGRAVDVSPVMSVRRSVMFPVHLAHASSR